MRKILAIVFLWVVSGISAEAQLKDLSKGSFMLLACEATLSEKRNVESGLCMGILEGLRFGGSTLEPKEIRFCVPDATSRIKVVEVVVKWMRDHPKELDDSFMVIAVVALNEAWPCR